MSRNPIKVSQNHLDVTTYEHGAATMPDGWAVSCRICGVLGIGRDMADAMDYGRAHWRRDHFVVAAGGIVSTSTKGWWRI